MTHCARAAFFASLLLVLVELGLPGRPGAADGGGGAVAESVQVHTAPHPSTWDARTHLPDARIHRVQQTPFAPTLPPHSASLLDFHAPEPVWFGAGTGPLILLPPSRAPPALS
ncbi:MAG: hypothetical protein WEF86_16855 [Gemmatimonadota bacterium]